MSQLRQRAARPRDARSGSTADAPQVTVPPDDLFELLNDDHVRRILRATRGEALPARELIDRCDASKPTVYRRLNRLEDAGLVTSRQTYDPDGHHRQTFRSTLEAVTVALTDDGIEADVATVDRRPDDRTAAFAAPDD
jgi:DNA-binding transcriptional ArsR family regulator